MMVTITVQADSEAEAEAWLDELAALGLRPIGRPKREFDRPRWMVRTQPDGQRVQRQPGRTCAQTHDGW